MALIHVNDDPIYLKFHVMIALAIKSKDIAHARASAALYANSEVVSLGYILGRHDVSDFLCSALC